MAAEGLRAGSTPTLCMQLGQHSAETSGLPKPLSGKHASKDGWLRKQGGSVTSSCSIRSQGPCVPADRCCAICLQACLLCHVHDTTMPAGSSGLLRYVLDRSSRLEASQRQQFLQQYSDKVLAAREQAPAQLRISFKGLLSTLDAQEVQGSLLPTAMRLAKR